MIKEEDILSSDLSLLYFFRTHMHNEPTSMYVYPKSSDIVTPTDF